MPPKKAPLDLVVPDDAPLEEDDEAPGNVVFSLEVNSVSNLPQELETFVVFGGACRPNRTNPAQPSSSPSGWEFPKPRFIRKSEQLLFDDLCSRELVISVRDAFNDGAVIGEATLSLAPLLHERREVGGELVLRLTPDYAALWSGEAVTEKPTSRQSKDKRKDAPASFDDQAQAPGPVPDPNLPTLISVCVSVPELVGPLQDRGFWTKVTAHIRGVFALPEPITALGGGDIESHPMAYKGFLLGEELKEGSLAKPPGQDDAKPVESADGGAEDQAAEPDNSDEEWRSLQERTGLSVRFKGCDPLVLYRGSGFIRDLQRTINDVGGVWFYLSLEEKAAPDPKKAAAGGPDVAALASRYKGKAWIDLAAIINPGVNSVDLRCPMLDMAEAVHRDTEEPTLRSSRTFVSLSLALSHEVTPPLPAVVHAPMQGLLPERQGINKFAPSNDASAIYRDAVKRTFEAVCRECSCGVRGGVAGAAELLKDAGAYKGCKEDMRRAIIHVFRERLRKDTGIIPGKPLEGGARDEVMSSAYTYLTLSIVEILDEIREDLPKLEPEAGDVSPVQPAITVEPPSGSVAKSGTFWKPGGNINPMQLSARSGQLGAGLGSTGTRWATTNTPSNQGREDAQPADEDLVTDPAAAALAEGEQVTHAREHLNGAIDAGARCKRLAFEAEILGSWDRAAEQLQSRLLLPEFKSDPKEWLAYAKFCSRSRGRQEAAEEALVQARALLESGEGLTSLEVELMLGCLLLDRSRHDEAIAIFRAWHAKDLAEPAYLFYLGLALFLAGEGDAGRPLLEAVGKSRDWFEGLEDDAAIAEKIASSRVSDGTLDPGPFGDCLEQLLDFGLPSLAFTFLDQCETLPEAMLLQEPFALVDARASAMDSDYASAVERLKPLLESNQASQKAWRLAGECYIKLSEPEKALSALQQAVSFEQQFEDAAVYISLGSVLLAKKRWKQARDAFVRSIQYQATAEAWLGVGYAEYHGGDLQLAYEALCEANLLDNGRPKVWGNLCLLHLRLENWDSADDCCRQCLKLEPGCEEALQEVAAEYVRLHRRPAFAEAAARSALQIRDSAPTLSTLSEALGQQGRVEEAVDAAREALKLLAQQPEARGPVLQKGLKMCEAAGRPDLQERLQEAQKAADKQYAERPLSAGG